MVQLGVLLCSSFNEKNEPVDGVTVVVAVAHRLADIVDNIDSITEVAQKASNDLKKPLFSGIAVIVEGETFGVAGSEDGSLMELSAKGILDCINFIVVKLFDEMVALTNDPVDDMLKKLGITRMNDDGTEYSGN